MNARVPDIQYMDQMLDPSCLGWSPSLPVELALGQQSIKEICQAYGLDKYTYERLRADPNFRRAVTDAIETLKEEGASFRFKARAQSVELLKTSWALIHQNEVPASVRADLIKFTIKAAGLDTSIEQKAQATASATAAAFTALTINLHLGSDD